MLREYKQHELEAIALQSLLNLDGFMQMCVASRLENLC